MSLVVVQCPSPVIARLFSNKLVERLEHPLRKSGVEVLVHELPAPPHTLVSPFARFLFRAAHLRELFDKVIVPQPLALHILIDGELGVWSELPEGHHNLLKELLTWVQRITPDAIVQLDADSLAQPYSHVYTLGETLSVPELRHRQMVMGLLTQTPHPLQRYSLESEPQRLNEFSAALVPVVYPFLLRTLPGLPPLPA